jgi:hypothetical protein
VVVRDLAKVEARVRFPYPAPFSPALLSSEGTSVMAKRSREDPRLARLIEISKSLPEVAIQRHGDHAAFLVRKKTFAYFLYNHHGDGIVAVTCKALPGDNTALVAAQPNRFYLPAYVGPRGWVALRLDLGEIDWDEVAELMRGSYLLTAPKRLADSIEASV